MTENQDSYERQLRARARELNVACGRLDAAARMLAAPAAAGQWAAIAAAIGRPGGRDCPPGSVTALGSAVHEHDGQADDLAEQTPAVLDCALGDVERATAAGDIQAALAAQTRLVLCEAVIEDVHAVKRRLHDIQDRLARHETAG